MTVVDYDQDALVAEGRRTAALRDELFRLTRGVDLGVDALLELVRLLDFGTVAELEDAVAAFRGGVSDS